MTKRCVLVMFILLTAICASAAANPSIDFIMREYSTNPCWIEFQCFLYTDFSGYTIRTLSGTAVIDSGVFGEAHTCVLLDQTNTSGFTLDSEGDSITVSWGDIIFFAIGFGNVGPNAAPLAGESALTAPNDGFRFNFCPNPTPGEWGDDNVPECIWSLTDVMLNEVAINNGWTQSSDFVELYNASDLDIDISGYQLICNSRYIIPDGTIIRAGKRYVVDETNFPEGFSPIINSDNLYFLLNDGCLVDQVGWSSNHGENVSLMRHPDGNARWGFYIDFSGYNDETSITFMDGFPTRRGYNRPGNPGLAIIGLQAEVRNDTVSLFWTDPIWQSTFQASIVRRSYSGYPLSPFEGELIYEGSNQKYSGDILPSGLTAYYTVFARTGCGEYSIPDSESQVSITGAVGVEENSPLPESFLTLESYPNPFNGQTFFEFELPYSSQVNLSIYDVSGRRIKVLANAFYSAGKYGISWEASNYSSGLYLARIRTDLQSADNKVILLK